MNDTDDLQMMCLYYKEVITDTNFYPYLNIQCGKADTGLSLGMLGDDVGDNLSRDNRYWSEITGLYWAWKNFERSKYVGLCSYRRFFNFERLRNPVQVCSKNELTPRLKSIDYGRLESIFNEADIILPVPYTYAWSIRRVCSMNYRDSDFEKLEVMIRKVQPAYLEAYKRLMYSSNNAIGHNMFIMKWEDFQDYCEWVFSILLPLSKEIDPQNYPVHQVRVFGYMHELLLAVYVMTRKLKVNRSQILWATDDMVHSRFNSLIYRTVCNMFFGLSRLAGNYYPHLVKK